MRFILLIFSFFVAEMQAQSISYKNWNEGQLKWNDFQYIHNDTSSEAARSFCGVEMTVAENKLGDSLVVNLYSVFSNLQSWTKDTLSDDLLKHEQLHFDITELGRRLMIKQLSSDLEGNKYSIAKVDSIYQDMVNLIIQLNYDYDQETSHGLELDLQILWIAKISAELNSLKDYSEPIIYLSKD
jgi:hypothetical protein